MITYNRIIKRSFVQCKAIGDVITILIQGLNNQKFIIMGNIQLTKTQN